MHEPYGGPDGLKRFVDACHARRLAVLLDVVYNHVGIGNHLAEFGPYFTDAHVTPWGPAVNLDQPGSDEVRDFLIGNALMWLRDYHIDGLRLDAVHALEDHRALHFLEQLAAEVHALAAQLDRELVLIAESDRNDPRVVTSREAGGYGLDAQWSDDFHHAVHAALTGERQGYYGDFGSLAALAKTLTRVFFHDGSWSSFRGRSARPAGRRAPHPRSPVPRLPPGPRPGRQPGHRRPDLRHRCPRTCSVGAGLVLTAPFTPMLFMGEEWGAGTPWQYFTDHTDPWLAEAVADGRGPSSPRTAGTRPTSPTRRTRRPSCAPSWTGRSGPRAAPRLLAWYRELIALRRARPELTDPRLDRVHADFDEDARWLVVRRGRLGSRPTWAGGAAAARPARGRAAGRLQRRCRDRQRHRHHARDRLRRRQDLSRAWVASRP